VKWVTPGRKVQEHETRKKDTTPASQGVKLAGPSSGEKIKGLLMKLLKREAVKKNREGGKRSHPPLFWNSCGYYKYDITKGNL